MDEVSDSDSDFGNGLLPTILEEDCNSDEEEIFDQEYGNPDGDSLSADDDAEESDGFDGVLLYEEDVNSVQKPQQLHDEIGGDNLLLSASTSATGKYRTVSVFGGVFDMPDPTSDSDSMSSSTDFSDDDWSVGEEVKAAPVSRRNNRSTMRRGQQQKAPRSQVASSLSSDAVSPQQDIVSSPPAKEKGGKIEDMSPLTDADLRKEGTAVPAHQNSVANPVSLQKEVDSNVDEQDTLAESFSTTSDILMEKEKLYHEPSSTEVKENLLNNFLNELCFIPIRNA